MQRIRTAFGDHHDLASHGHAVFSTEGVGDHAVLADPFDPQRTSILGSGRALGQIRHDCSVQQIIVRAQGRAIAAEPQPDCGGRNPDVSVLSDSGLQQSQINEIPAIERQFGDFLLINESAERSGRRVHQGSVLRHDHCLVDCPGLHREVDHSLL